MTEHGETPRVGGRDRRLKQVAYLALLVPVLGLFVFALFPDSAPTREVYGVVLRLASTPATGGEQHHLVVRLDSGEEVVSRIPGPDLFRKSARVRLHRHVPRLSGRPVFRFRGYVDRGA